MKQIEVSILGQSYVLGCPDGGDTLLHASVKAVDREMTAIRTAGKVKARERIAVLAALNLAYKLEQRTTAPTPTASEGRSATDEADAQVNVDALIARIDEALGEHGQLL
ncbi:MAG: cell division protein ZapA [Burkholderiales bacterium PBB1]|nr:MAG: cell division protein ZapA [Burkholderiales bacterium PBB1]